MIDQDKAAWRPGSPPVPLKRPRRNEKDAWSLAKQRDKAEEVEEEDGDHTPGPFHKGTGKNKEQILIFSSRGIYFRTRHLMQDLRMLMPHSKTGTKIDSKDKLFVINVVCDVKDLNKCIYFEGKKKQDLGMCLS